LLPASGGRSAVAQVRGHPLSVAHTLVGKHNGRMDSHGRQTKHKGSPARLFWLRLGAHTWSGLAKPRRRQNDNRPRTRVAGESAAKLALGGAAEQTYASAAEATVTDCGRQLSWRRRRLEVWLEQVR